MSEQRPLRSLGKVLDRLMPVGDKILLKIFKQDEKEEEEQAEWWEQEEEEEEDWVNAGEEVSLPSCASHT